MLKKDALFQWTEAHDVVFQNTKNQGDVCLRHFSTTKDVVLQVDSSQVGLGTVLLQDDKPVAYASKALIPAETSMLTLKEKCLQ